MLVGLLSTFWTVGRVVEFDHMPATNCKGDLYLFTQELLLHLRFEHQVPTVGLQNDVGHRTAVTQGTSPGAFIVRVRIQQAALFFVHTAKIVAVEKATIDRLIHGLIQILIPLPYARGIQRLVAVAPLKQRPPAG